MLLYNLHNFDMLVAEVESQELKVEYQATKGEHEGLRIVAKML